MARQLRIQYEGAIYHLMSQGDRREEIFRDALDRSVAKVGRLPSVKGSAGVDRSQAGGYNICEIALNMV
jgi:hypothetical protein